MKTCIQCGTALTGKQQKYCSKTCLDNWHNSHSNKARRAELTKLKQDIKMERGCAVCGYDKHPAALHFDHIDPSTKKYSLGNNTVPKSKVLEEIAKCQVLCANCHAEKTWRNRYEQDGTMDTGGGTACGM